MGRINYFYEDISFDVPQPRKLKSWILKAAKQEKVSIGELNYIFCSDRYLSSINKEYLNHKSLTDIVTFDNREDNGPLAGDIFISVDRVRDNAAKYEVQFAIELKRVMIHGVLHLMGYSDKKPAQKAVMRKKEESYLSLWNERKKK